MKNIDAIVERQKKEDLQEHSKDKLSEGDQIAHFIINIEVGEEKKLILKISGLDITATYSITRIK